MEVQITAVVLVNGKEDKELLSKCLKSISWCKKVLIIDTSKIKGSFSEWRNEGLKQAKSDWILYVDSDEEVTQALKHEIELKITNLELKINGYAIPRKNIIFGKEFKYSGQYPDYQKRLFKKDCLKKWVGDVHEEPVFEGELQLVNNSLIHHKNMTISEMIDKTNKWSEIEADLMIKAKHPPMNILRFTSVALREFWIKFIKEKAFMDGKEGVIYGIYQIYSRLISYSKLWEKQQSIIHI